MKVLSTDGLTKLIQLIKSAFISVDDTVTTSTTTLATVATSGSYNDLSNKPTIPDTSNLANKDLSNLSSTGNAKFQSKQDVSNLVTSISASSTDAQYPSAKCMYDIVGDVVTLINAL